MPPRRAPRLAVLAALFALATACASPTLPLPPPSAPTFEPSSVPGKLHLKSERGVEPNAIVVIYNRNPSVPLDQRVSGAQADGNGTWDADVVATAGDYLDISQESGAASSPSITVQVPR